MDTPCPRAVDPTGPRRWPRHLPTLLVLALAACQAPVAPRPLDEDGASRAVAESRARRAPDAGPLDLATAVRLLREGNPALAAARARLGTACAVAATRTPAPNPRLALGPLLTGTPDLLGSVFVGLTGALGWSFPLTGELRRVDDLHAVEARAARVEVLAVEREEYLALRADLLAASGARHVETAVAGLAAAARDSVDAARRALGAGAGTALDVRLLELEAASQEAERLEVHETAQVGAAGVAERLGLAGVEVPASPSALVPSLPERVPDEGELQRVIHRHPALERLRAEHAVAESRLRLEAARSVPWLDVGVDYEDEGDSTLFGLPVGIEIPISDRNQPGIAEACARRAEVEARYRATLAAIEGRVATARTRLLARVERLSLRREQLDPAEEALALAVQIRDQAGELDMVRYLEVFRAAGRARVEVARAQADLDAAWGELETAAGGPLLRFVGEEGPTPGASVAPGR